MKLSRREALVGAVAAVVAPKVPLPSPAPVKLTARWSDPWAGALDPYDVYTNIVVFSAMREIQEEEDRRFLKMLGELTGEDPGPAGNRCVPEKG